MFVYEVLCFVEKNKYYFVISPPPEFLRARACTTAFAYFSYVNFFFFFLNDSFSQTVLLCTERNGCCNATKIIVQNT